MRLPLAWLAPALLLGGCAALHPVGGLEDAAALTARLTAQAGRWDQAIVRRDRAAIEANLADDFRQIDGAGQVEGKEAFVRGLLDPDLRIDPYAVEDLDVRVYGEVALLSGTTRMTGSYRGKPFATHYRYVDLYVRRDGQWRVAGVQITRIAE